MSGYLLASGPCGACGNLFSFSPSRVPSFGGRPLCADCMSVINAARKAKGLDPFPILCGAYDAEDA